MTREISSATKKDIDKILKKKGMKKDTFINYNPKSRGERISLEVGVISKVNEVLKDYGLFMIMAGVDSSNEYLFKIIKKEQDVTV